MASFQITDRPETTSPLNDDNFLMQNSGTGETKRVTFGNLTGPFVAQIEEKIFEVGNVEKRQTVLYGAIDSNGYANFLTGNGTATLTLDATPTPVVVTWASGDANYKATISADLTLDISGYANGTYYAYVNYNNGTPTLGAVSLVPTDGYGAASTTNNQHHFRIPEMKMYVGNGSTASETLRVFVGEFTVSSGTISAAPVTYALRGEYYTTVSAAINVQKSELSHKIGTTRFNCDVDFWSVTNNMLLKLGLQHNYDSSSRAAHLLGTTRLTTYFVKYLNNGGTTGLFVNGLGSTFSDTSTSSYYIFTLKRGY